MFSNDELLQLIKKLSNIDESQSKSIKLLLEAYANLRKDITNLQDGVIELIELKEEVDRRDFVARQGEYNK